MIITKGSRIRIVKNANSPSAEWWQIGMEGIVIGSYLGNEGESLLAVVFQQHGLCMDVGSDAAEVRTASDVEDVYLSDTEVETLYRAESILNEAISNSI